jgi:hypothetical protein
MALSLALNCYVLGEDLDLMFTVKIKEKKAPHLRVNHVDASDLDVWKVDRDLPTLALSNFFKRLT